MILVHIAPCACLLGLAISVAASGYLYVGRLRSDLALATTKLEAERATSKALHDQVVSERAVRVAVDKRLAGALAEGKPPRPAIETC